MRHSVEWIAEFGVFCELDEPVSVVEGSFVACKSGILPRRKGLLLFSSMEVRALDMIGIDAARWFIAWCQSITNSTPVYGLVTHLPITWIENHREQSRQILEGVFANCSGLRSPATGRDDQSLETGVK